jgi:hypothetical protein
LIPEFKKLQSDKEKNIVLRIIVSIANAAVSDARKSIKTSLT